MENFFSSLTPSEAFSEHVRFNLRRYIIAAGCAALCLYLLLALVVPPFGFPVGKIVVIPAGATLGEAAAALKDAGVISSGGLLSLYVRLAGSAGSVHAGAYLFDHPEGLVRVGSRITNGLTGIKDARVTIPEGFTARDMSLTYAKMLPEVSAPDFLAFAAPYEGYLFPDTYSFSPAATSSDIVRAMLANFDERTASITPAVKASGRSLHDIVTLASIIEKEANTPADRRMVAGILLNRIRIGMPLQVDAVFGYISGTATHAPTVSDLATDSPYNTYLYKGLPPGPIDNPGLDSILAALYPTKTTDLYYLTGKDGKMHYAKTFEEHQVNRERYL